MWVDEQDDEDNGGWLRRSGRIAIGVLLVGGIAGILYAVLSNTSLPERHAINTVTRIVLPPPPAPPPPPPKPPEPEKVVEQPKIQEPKPVDKPPESKPTPKPAQPPLSPLTAEAGTGANPYGLQVGNGSGDVIGGGGGGGALSYMSYGRVVSTEIQSALQRDDKLRFGHFVADLRVWVDASGHVARVQLVSSSGDTAIDGALTQLLSGLSMGEPPPQGMPQPIRLRTRAMPG